MAGIISFGAYVPSSRLARARFAQAWGGNAAPGERAVASFDEDSLTLATEAALNALAIGPIDPQTLDACFFASTTAPYKEKQAASVLATVADLRRDVRTADFTDSLRSATLALQAALDAVKGGSAQRVLVAAGDTRMGAPESSQEQTFGDGAAALVIGQGDDVVAEISATHTHMDEFVDAWRRDRDNYVQTFEERWQQTYGFQRNTVEAIKGLMQQTGWGPDSFAKVVFYAPDARSYATVAGQLGFNAQTQLVDVTGLYGGVGNTGASFSLLLLVAALEQAEPGQRLLFAGYGDGADAFVLEITNKITERRERNTRDIARQLAAKLELSSYEKFQRYRNPEFGQVASTFSGSNASPIALWRERKQDLALYGARCRKCGTTQYPMQRVCVGCSAKDDFEEVKMPHTAKVFTYTVDYLNLSPNPPTVMCVLEWDNGARVYMQMTDVDAETVQVGMPVELTFRRLHDEGGFNAYFWKCRPLRYAHPELEEAEAVPVVARAKA